MLVHIHHSRVGPLVASLPQQCAQHFLVLLKLVLREEVFMSDPIPLGPVTEVKDVFSNSNLPSTLRGNQGQER